VTAVLLGLSCSAEELSVAAASDLSFALKEIAQKYQHDTGNTLKLSFGSSGNFFVQIQNGAPFDIFFSADLDYPKKLEQAGLAEPCTLESYGSGKIVLWVPNHSQLDVSNGMKVLLDPAIRKIAIANPGHAPYGRAAEQALKKSGIYDEIKEKLVIGENISQTAQFVQTGNADIAIVALSLALSPTMKSDGRFVEISTDLYDPLTQALIVLKSSTKKGVVRTFLEYMQQIDVQQILRKYGFRPADRIGVCG
jgi:molybdate transport system substrate-binding protein